MHKLALASSRHARRISGAENRIGVIFFVGVDPMREGHQGARGALRNFIVTLACGTAITAVLYLTARAHAQSDRAHRVTYSGIACYDVFGVKRMEQHYRNGNLTFARNLIRMGACFNLSLGEEVLVFERRPGFVKIQVTQRTPADDRRSTYLVWTREENIGTR